MQNNINKVIPVLGMMLLIVGGLMRSAAADTAAAVSYLTNQQQTNGSYVGQNSVATFFQSTSETIRALTFVGENSQSNISLARTFLDATNLHNTEYLSRLLVLATQTGENTQVLVNELLKHQNNDGGFGDFPGYNSTVLDSAFALEAIAESGQQPASVASAVNYLIATQTAEGAWADGSNDPSVYLSALSMRALWHYKNVFSGVAEAIASTQNYLLSQRNMTTGLWFETHESALALIALVPNVNEFAQLESILTDLRSQQLSDGSWEGDAYVTALVLRALASQPTPQPPVITSGTITGRILNSITKQTISNASVSIDSLSLSVTTDSAGEFTLTDLDPTSYNLSTGATGYSTINFSGVMVNIGTDTSLGDVLLSPLPTTGVLQGQVTDAISKQFLQGVMVTVMGSSTASTTTLTDGSFSIVSLNPGTITIVISKDGYLPVSANTTIMAGATLVLNPALTATDSSSKPLTGTATTGVLRGLVSDVTTGLPLQLASVSIRDAADNSSLGFAQTSINGAYEILNLEPANIIVSVSKTGYIKATASASVSAGNALVFSPGLVPIGGDPNSGTGSNVGKEPLPGTLTTGVLQGIVSDQETSLPLSGVAINLTGSSTVSTTSGIDGSYSITGIVPGEISVSASLATYVDVSATATVVAGNAIVFNPQLPPQGYVGNDVGIIVGRVVDAGTQNPLGTVLVNVTGSIGTTTVSTDVNGNFKLADLPPDDYSVSIERLGYVTRSFNAIVTSGGSVDFQTIELSLALTKVAVYGQLIDVDTAQPIENAVVSVSGTVLNSQTDAQGRYRLEGLDIGSKTFVFSATGYSSQTLIFSFSQGGEFEINRDLSLTANSGVDITFLSTDQASYTAYAPVTIQANVNNNGSPVDAMAVFLLFNTQDKLVSEYSGMRVGSSDALITFPSSSITSVEAKLNTANLPPGEYRLLGRIVVGNQLIGPATIILDERVTRFSIEPTNKVGDITVEMLPKFSAVGVTENIDLLATISNRSNIESSISLRYRIIDPKGINVVRKNTNLIQLPVEKDTVILSLDSFSHLFTSAGEHTLIVSYAGGSGGPPDNIYGDSISVGPGLRIDPSQSVTPGTVTPDENQRIRINIRLKGKEIQ